jgi:hypothetical protein
MFIIAYACRLYGSLKKCGGVAKPQDLKIPWSGQPSPLKLEVLEAQYFSHSAAFAFDCVFVSPYVPENAASTHQIANRVQ